VGRGPERVVTAPFSKAPVDCIGCLACATNCPTGNIPYTQKNEIRTIWKRDFELVPCPECGTLTFTHEQLVFYGKDPSDLCPNCKKRKMAKSLLINSIYTEKEGLYL
jgi:ferredoxin